MSKLFGIADLWPAMQTMYPEVEDEREDDDDYEHPMTAVGLILLSAALLQTIEPRELRLFTGYSREFISAKSCRPISFRVFCVASTSSREDFKWSDKSRVSWRTLNTVDA